MCWTCDHPDVTRDQWADHVRSLIPDGGAMVQAVSGGTRAAVAYTVGLTRVGHDELLVIGIEPQVARPLLNHVAQYVVERSVLRAGETMEAGPWMLEVVAVPHPEVHLPTAGALYGLEVSAVQLVWADADGRWPWDPGHGGGSGGQPVLGPREPLRCGHLPER